MSSYMPVTSVKFPKKPVWQVSPSLDQAWHFLKTFQHLWEEGRPPFYRWGAEAPRLRRKQMQSKPHWMVCRTRTQAHFSLSVLSHFHKQEGWLRVRGNRTDMSHRIHWSFPAFSCCVEPREVRNYWRCSSPLRKGCSVPGISRLNCSFLPSRYQEGLKKTKELQELEEEEERKSESPEEAEEAEDIEDEGKDQRSRLEPLPLLKRVTIH